MTERKLKISAAIILAIIMTAFSLLYSYCKFSSINIPRILYAVSAVNIGNEDYVVVRKGKNKVIIASAGEGAKSFNNYLKENGYNYREQLGAMHTVEKNSVKERVFVYYNRYYGLWIWDGRQ